MSGNHDRLMSSAETCSAGLEMEFWIGNVTSGYATMQLANANTSPATKHEYTFAPIYPGVENGNALKV